MTWILVFLLISRGDATSQAVMPGFTTQEECKVAGEKLKKDFSDKKLGIDSIKEYSCIQQTKSFWGN